MGLGLLAACPLLVAVLAAPADDLRPPVGITSWVHFDGSTRAGSTRQEVSLAGGRVETRETSVYDLIVAKGLQVHIETDATITETLEGRPVTFRAVHTMQRRGTSTLAAVTFRTEGFLGEDGRIHAERRSSRSDQVETVVLDWGDDCCLYWGCDRLTRHLGHGPAGARVAFRKLDAVSLTLDPGSFTLGPRETVEVAGGPRVLTRAEFTVADAVSVQHMERDFTAHRLEVVWTFTDPGSRPVPMVSCLASEALARDPGATRAEVLSTLPPGIPPPRVAVAVMAGEGDATDPGLRARLAAFLGASLAREAGLEAVPGEAVTRRLEEAVAAGAAACTGTACLDELARSLDAGWLLRPVLHRTGFRCTLAASLKATRDGADEREARLATDCSEGALMVAAAALALNLREVHPGLAVSPR